MEFQGLLLILLINLGCVVAELSLRYVFIVEAPDKDLPERIGEAIKELEKNSPEVRMDDDIIQLDRASEDEGYRKWSEAALGVGDVATACGLAVQRASRLKNFATKQ